MAEKSKEKKRSGSATVIATALALVVGGTALWSINRSISHTDVAATGSFPKDKGATAMLPKANTAPAQATLALAPPPKDADMPAMPPAPVITGPLAARMSDTADLFAKPTGEDVDPDRAAMEETHEARTMKATTEAESLAAIATASGPASLPAEIPQTAAPAAAAQSVATDVMPETESPKVVAGASYFIAIGSYLRRSNAELVMRQRQSWNPKIVDAMVEGRHYYRLLVGPFSFNDLAPARARMRQAGIVGEWPIRADRSLDRADLALLSQ